MSNTILSEETINSLKIVKAITSVALGIFAIFGTSDVYGFVRKHGWIAMRKDGLLHRQTFWLRTVLFANTMLSIVTFCILLFDLSAVPFNMSPAACDVLMKSALLTYTTSFQTILLFFVLRITFVKELLRSSMHKTISRITTIGLIVLVPVFNLGITLVASEGIITLDGVCIVYNTAIWAPIAFSLVMCLLTVVLLYLFMAPLQASYAKLAPATVSKLKRITRWNIGLTLLSMTATFLSVVTFSWLNFRSIQRNYTNVLSLAAPVLKMLISTVCARLMTLEENDIASIQDRMFKSGMKLRCFERSESLTENGTRTVENTRPLPSSAPYYTDNGVFPA